MSAKAPCGHPEDISGWVDDPRERLIVGLPQRESMAAFAADAEPPAHEPPIHASRTL